MTVVHYLVEFVDNQRGLIEDYSFKPMCSHYAPRYRHTTRLLHNPSPSSLPCSLRQQLLQEKMKSRRILTLWLRIVTEDVNEEEIAANQIRV